MNSLILLHNKYPKNSANKNNIDNNRNSIDFDDNNEKLNNSFEKDNHDDKKEINNSYQISNSPNNIFDLSYIKNKNLYNMSNTIQQISLILLLKKLMIYIQNLFLNRLYQHK